MQNDMLVIIVLQCAGMWSCPLIPSGQLMTSHADAPENDSVLGLEQLAIVAVRC